MRRPKKSISRRLSIAPDSSDALIALSNLYMREKRFDDAQATLRKLIALHPNDAGAHFQLGRMLAIARKERGRGQRNGSGIETRSRLIAKLRRDLAELDADVGKI